MNSRQRVLTTISRREPDRVPTYLWLVPSLIEQLKRERGVNDFEEYLKMDIRFVNYQAEPEANDFSIYTENFNPKSTVDDWGCGTYSVGYYHFTKAECPMRGIETFEQVANYPFPKKQPQIDKIHEDVQAIQRKGLACCSSYESGTFEQAHALMGMEELLANMYISPKMIELLFDRISDVKASIAAAYVEAGVDILWIGDDIGIQSGPIMDPKMWQKYLIPSLKKIIQKAKSVRSDIPVAYHSCGSIGFAVKGLIDAGVDILQSFQPEANNCAELKRKYGERISFWGGVGSQSTMSQGTPQDVKNEIKHLMKTVGIGGGYICSPAHFIEPETPLENIDAFIEAIEEFGQYQGH